MRALLALCREGVGELLLIEGCDCKGEREGREGEGGDGEGSRSKEKSRQGRDGF